MFLSVIDVGLYLLAFSFSIYLEAIHPCWFLSFFRYISLIFYTCYMLLHNRTKYLLSFITSHLAHRFSRKFYHFELGAHGSIRLRPLVVRHFMSVTSCIHPLVIQCLIRSWNIMDFLSKTSYYFIYKSFMYAFILAPFYFYSTFIHQTLFWFNAPQVDLWRRP